MSKITIQTSVLSPNGCESVNSSAVSKKQLLGNVIIKNLAILLYIFFRFAKHAFATRQIYIFIQSNCITRQSQKILTRECMFRTLQFGIKKECAPVNTQIQFASPEVLKKFFVNRS